MLDNKVQIAVGAGIVGLGVFGMMFATVFGDSLIYTLGLGGAYALGRFAR